jgi:hypothetical protein
MDAACMHGYITLPGLSHLLVTLEGNPLECRWGPAMLRVASSIVVSLIRCRCAVSSILVELKTLSISDDIAGIEKHQWA